MVKRVSKQNVPTPAPALLTPEQVAEGRLLVAAYHETFEGWLVALEHGSSLPRRTPRETVLEADRLGLRAYDRFLAAERSMRQFVLRVTHRTPLSRRATLARVTETWQPAGVLLDGVLWEVTQDQKADPGQVVLSRFEMATAARAADQPIAGSTPRAAKRRARKTV